MSLTYFFFFFNDTATTEIYTLSLHDALPISGGAGDVEVHPRRLAGELAQEERGGRRVGLAAVVLEVGDGALDALLDRKSTRLNSSHANISYAVFCLKKKKS